MIATKAKRLSLLTCSATPLVVLAVLRAVVPGVGPVSARAANPVSANQTEEPAVPPRDISVDPRVLEAIRELDRAPLGSSPLIAPQIRTAGVDAPTPVYIPAATGGFVREFNLSSIVGGRTAVAVIDGQLRKVGDDLGGGWSVQSIDSTTKDVVIAGPDNATKTLTLRR